MIMVKDSTCYLTTATEAQKMLDRPRKVPPEPKMVDKLLDLPEDERQGMLGAPYNDPATSVINPTVLPDRLVHSFAPAFIIRHSAKQIESWYRASRIFGVQLDQAGFEICTTYKFSRRLFDYYKVLYRSDNSM